MTCWPFSLSLSNILMIGQKENNMPGAKDHLLPQANNIQQDKIDRVTLVTARFHTLMCHLGIKWGPN